MDPIIGAIVGAIFTGILSLVGVIFTNNTNNVRMEGKFEKHQAVTDTKLDTMRDEVREIAAYTKRVPVIETEIVQIKQDADRLKADVEKLKNESH